jgi:hypothetical protein
MVRTAAVPVSRDTAPVVNAQDCQIKGLGIAYYERYALKLLRGDFRNAGAPATVAEAEFADMDAGYVYSGGDALPVPRSALPERLERLFAAAPVV